MLDATANEVTGFAFVLLAQDFAFCVLILVAYVVSASSIMREEARVPQVMAFRGETELGPVSSA